MNTEQHAANLVEAIMDFHGDVLATHRTPGDELFDAIVIKQVALTVLAFGIPATSDETEPDYEDALMKLRWANSVLMPRHATERKH